MENDDRQDDRKIIYINQGELNHAVGSLYANGFVFINYVSMSVRDWEMVGENSSNDVCVQDNTALICIRRDRV